MDFGDAALYLRPEMDGANTVDQNDVWIPITGDSLTTYVKGRLQNK